MKIVESVEMKSRTYFSITHILSASYLTRQALILEESFDGTYSEQLFAQHKAYVTGALFTAVSFLEANVNELFSDTTDESTLVNDSKLKNLDSRAIRIMSSHWERGIPRSASYPIVEKYQIALELAEKTLFDKGQSPTQDIQLLVSLRNALIHYEPEWIINHSEMSIKEHKFESALKSRFEPSKLFGSGNAYYPNRLLGHGCAEWAVNNSIKFVEQFCDRLGIVSRFDHVRKQLNTR